MVRLATDCSYFLYNIIMVFKFLFTFLLVPFRKRRFLRIEFK